jgi:reductive dehalogenase
MVTFFLIAFDLVLVGLLTDFFIACVREKEPRAPKVAATMIVSTVLLVPIILWVPQSKAIVGIVFASVLGIGLLLLIPPRVDKRIPSGASRHVVEKVNRVDERDIVFARLRLQPDNAPYYRKYYDSHPGIETADAKRREKGLLGILGSIDNAYQPNAAMVHASFDIPDILGPHAKADPVEREDRMEWDPAMATNLVKNYARHIGADMVGICKVDPMWVYSHRGEIHYDNWDDWGKELSDFPPYAVVMLTEMNWDHVSGSPHTPSVTESAHNYGKGAYLSTLMGRWFAHMGYTGVAQNTRNYDALLVPIAVDAGLGEMGRNGYLVAPKYGARVRIFATLTDMPLIPDKPVTLGVEEFCQKCKKCAESCPSRSIPLNEKTVFNGSKRWKLNEDTCFEYWGKVGTDCSICMAVCPFSRPDTFSHKLVRLLLSRSWAARTFFPIIDNYLYGKRWKPRQVLSWLDYTKGVNAGKKDLLIK